MVITKRNVEAAAEITKILAEKECTIEDLHGILSYVEMVIRKHSTVQKKDYSEVFDDLLTVCDEPY